MINHFGAAQLIKSSAAQIAYYRSNNKQPDVTPGQIQGEKHQDAVVKECKLASERRGTYVHEDNHIHFCIDAFDKDKNLFIEIKSVRDQENYEDWYLHSSVLQSCLYKSLLHHTHELVTPEFKVKEGYAQYTDVLDVNDEINFELWFGTDKYIIEQSQAVFEHYIKKVDFINYTLRDQDWSYVREFDQKYKHREYDILQPIYRKIG